MNIQHRYRSRNYSQMSARTEAITLRKELTATNKELKETKITVAPPTTNSNYSKMVEKNPVNSLVIPNKLFILWNRRRALEGKLRQNTSEYVVMANESLNDIILNTSAASLKKKLSTENSRFQTRYKKMGGALCAALILKHTNIMLLESEILSSANTCNVETTAATSASSNTSTSSTTSDECSSTAPTARIAPETVRLPSTSINTGSTSLRQVRVTL